MTEADKKIVVCHVTTVHPSRDPRIFEKECRTLVQAGYEVHLVAQHPRDEVLEGVQIHALPTPRSRIDRATRIKRCAREWVERIGPRIVHFHDPELITLGSSLRRQGRVVVYDVHENTYDQILHKPYIPRLLRPLAATAYRWVERRHLRGLATVHVLDTIAQRYPQPRVTVRNLPMIQTAAAEMPVKDFGARPIRLIYAGAVSRTRGGMTMLHLAEDLDRTGVDFQLEIIGICRDAALQAEMKQFVAENHLAGRVSLPGPVPYAEAQRRIGESHIGLCLLHPVPNYLNSLPTKILEYMSLGLPVVSSDFDCCREFVGDVGSGIMVDPLDRPKLAQAVASLVANGVEMQRMSRAGWQVVREQYCWEVEVQKLLAFYQELLRKG